MGKPRECFTCDGTGTMCNVCGESADACDCDNGCEGTPCTACNGVGTAILDQPKQTQLITGDQAKPCATQHKTPCSDCPWSRKALPGWLGSLTAPQWLNAAHGEDTADCHTKVGPQCAGMAIYRANMAKVPRNPNALVLEHDHKKVFSTPTQFMEHHAKPALPKKKKKR